MSKIKVPVSIIHVPSFNEFKISRADLAYQYREMGVKMPFPHSDAWYYHTDVEGWTNVLMHLIIKSNLYKKDRFDCEDYAIKAMVTCAELYGLNSLRYTYGGTPLGAHGFNSLWTGEEFLLFEPNMGFLAQFDFLIFDWGSNGYNPSHVLL